MLNQEEYCLVLKDRLVGCATIPSEYKRIHWGSPGKDLQQSLQRLIVQTGRLQGWPTEGWKFWKRTVPEILAGLLCEYHPAISISVAMSILLHYRIIQKASEYEKQDIEKKLDVLLQGEKNLTKF